MSTAIQKNFQKNSQKISQKSCQKICQKIWKTWAADWGHLKNLEKLAGDASTRTYFRATSSKGSYILVYQEPFLKKGDKLPFLELQRFLKSAHVDVPAVYVFDAKAGIILQEDLGNLTLLHWLNHVLERDAILNVYRKVIDDLAKFQRETELKSKTLRPSAFELSFDVEKLMWEVQFTIKHFLQGYLGRKIKPPHLKQIRDGFLEICKTLAAQPPVLCHRDFHSRNLMIVPKDPPKNLETGNYTSEEFSRSRIVMIDFQDARMGPCQYDLVSLLRDSYYQLDDAAVNELGNYYLEQTKMDPDWFWEIFDLMTLQRNFKAIGSFASFSELRGNPQYLKYIGNTFENIRKTLLAHPKLHSLGELLFHYYYF